MSIQSMVSNQPIRSEKLLDDYFSDTAMKLLKKRRFEVGCINKPEIKDLLILDKVAKRYTCKMDQDLREHLVTSAVESIRELR